MKMSIKIYIFITLVCLGINYSLNCSEISSPDSCSNAEKSSKEVQAEYLIKEAKTLDYEVPEEYKRFKKIIREFIELTHKAPQQLDFDALEYAILAGDIELIKLLLRNNANPKFQNKYKRTAYNYLARYSSERSLHQKENKHYKEASPDVIKKLLDKYAKNF